MKDTETIEIYEKLREIEIKLVRIEERVENINSQLQSVARQIYGNGKSGLLDRIQNLEKFEVRVMAIAGFATIIVNTLFYIAVRYAIR